MTTTCRSCGHPIIWAKAEHSGKSIPLDAEPSERGNIVLREDMAVVLYGPDDFGAAHKVGETLYLSHFVTCKQAKQWRRK